MKEHTIIFVTNLQDDVQGGIQLATQLAVQQAATLVFVHVIPVRGQDGEGMLHAGSGLFCEREKEQKLRSLTPEHPGVPYRHILRMGEPFSEIVDVVEQEGADMLVLSTRRRSFLRRFWGTSLIQQLQGHVTCPVVTYHAQSKSPLRVRPWRGTSSSPETLATLLDARTDALLGWLTLQHTAVQAISQRASIKECIVSLTRGQRWSLDRPLMRRIKSELALELGEFQRALGALGVEVHSPYSEIPLLHLGQRVEHGVSQQRWLQKLREGGAGVSLPVVSGPRGECVLQSGACVPMVDGPPALLLFTLDARRDFFRILAQPGPTPSTETYAFDQDGLMLSYSRFPDQLRRIGLLPSEPGAQTPCRLHVCDPGGNLLYGEGFLDASRRLTRMAAAATAGEDGHDWSGYRDYRGVPVVGAWRWLPEYGFGIAAEMDAASVA